MRNRQDGKSSRLLVWFTWVVPLALLVLSGCVSLAKSYPDKHYYALDVTGKGSPVFLCPGPYSTFERLFVSPRFKGQELVYRTDDTRYESDFLQCMVCLAQRDADPTGAELAEKCPGCSNMSWRRPATWTRHHFGGNGDGLVRGLPSKGQA